MLTWKTPEECWRFWRFLVGQEVLVFQYPRDEYHHKASHFETSGWDLVIDVRVREALGHIYLEIVSQYFPQQPFVYCCLKTNPHRYISMQSFFYSCKCGGFSRSEFVPAFNGEYCIDLGYYVRQVTKRFNYHMLLCASVGHHNNTMARFFQHPLCDFRKLWQLIQAYVETP